MEASAGRVLVKICGMTRASDLSHAAACGADAVGFILAESPRRVSVEQAAELAASVRNGPMLFGVFADSPVDEVVAAAVSIGLDAVQLHGREPLSCVMELSEALPGRKLVKAVRVKGRESIREAAEFAEGGAWAVLLDAYRKGARGGTGESFEWALASGLAAEFRVILAGGLTPANVGEAIRRVSPFMVDVSTGVESSPGVKDPALVAAFIEAARRAKQAPKRPG